MAILCGAAKNSLRGTLTFSPLKKTLAVAAPDEQGSLFGEAVYAAPEEKGRIAVHPHRAGDVCCITSLVSGSLLLCYNDTSLTVPPSARGCSYCITPEDEWLRCSP